MGRQRTRLDGVTHKAALGTLGKRKKVQECLEACEYVRTGSRQKG